ncbi:hypothetical protein V6N11_004518 [Hibiscus sabdariffa]|uniref:DUF4283 domain-containing protein n=1 Tax=Hibiscus sabdariffa TaxID=183260 RepID=A0ABR2SH60_9ROSI
MDFEKMEQQRWKSQVERGGRSRSLGKQNSLGLPLALEKRASQNFHGGFAVFVNYVSKGFTLRSRAMKVVERANNRLMDGFKIKVFNDRNNWGRPWVARSTCIKEPKVQKLDHVVRAKGIDGRSYKEVLLSNVVPTKMVEEVVNSHVVAGNNLEFKVHSPNSVERMSLEIKEKGKEWLKKSLVGQIAAMYDANFVQQILVVEGFKVKVRKMRKLRVWVRVEGLPLEA